jgi:polysaccharide biosynthesis protein PslH
VNAPVPAAALMQRAEGQGRVRPRLRLAFISPIFLFPLDAGGKIRSSNILRGLKGGAFEITLLSPASEAEQARHAQDIASVCDHFIPWRASRPARWQRVLHLLQGLPVSVAADRSAEGLAAVAQAARAGFDLMVFDFVHAAVLMPPALPGASLCFTHNVEAEILARHAEQARSPWMRALWRQQHAKMERYEVAALRRFTSVVAVSERDATHFQKRLGLPHVHAIPTAVDLDHFAYTEPAAVPTGQPATVSFTGSMDSAANIEGARWFIQAIWPRVLAQQPQARFVVVGRNPPAGLVALGAKVPGVHFTGSVPDVRPLVQGSQVAVIPLQVGGGTRIKAFEAMAMGVPVVSTSLGVEGLPVVAGEHFVQADEAQAFADAVLALLDKLPQRQRLARAARHLVESRYGHAVAAAVFEQIAQGACKTHAAV